MMLLVFQAGQNRYGLDATSVREVVPALATRSVPHAPAEVAGLIDYRGRVVPVIDLSLVLTGKSSVSRLNTRIILTEVAQADGTPRLVGLLAERVSKTVKISAEVTSQPAVQTADAPYLDGIVHDETGMIQRVEARNILPEAMLVALASGDSPAAGLPKAAGMSSGEH